MPVRISKDRRIATDVILTVNPMTISQAEELEGVLPGAMPEDPYSPNRAGIYRANRLTTSHA